VGGHIVRVELDGFGVVGNRMFMVAFARIRDRAIVENRGIAGREAHGFGEIRDRAIKIPLPVISKPSALEGVHALGVELDGAGKVCNGVLVVLRGGIGNAAACESNRVAWVKFYRPIVVGDCRVDLTARFVSEGAIGITVGKVSIQTLSPR
jgi:hypothetical protein